MIDRTSPADHDLLDRIQAELVTREQLEDEITSEVYQGLRRFCKIPDGYAHCKLGYVNRNLDSMNQAELSDLLNFPPDEIVNPQPVHLRAVEFFRMILEGNKFVCEQQNPLSPTAGAYLYGPPGVGKTHLLAAFGLEIESLLEEKLVHVKKTVGEITQSAFKVFQQRESGELLLDTEDEIGHLELTKSGIQAAKPAKQEFWNTVNDFKQRLKRYEYQPTDLLYIGFKELCEICKFGSQRSDAMDAIDRARIVIVDDVHPQGDQEQVQIILHLLERRYELGRAGTFLTTNLNTESLGGGDEMLGKRLMSRCAETLVTFDFSGCADWRTKIKARRISLIEGEIQSRLESTVIPDSQASTGMIVENVDFPD